MKLFLYSFVAQFVQIHYKKEIKYSRFIMNMNDLIICSSEFRRKLEGIKMSPGFSQTG